MSTEFGKNGEARTCGIYLGGAGNGDTFEFTMPKDLALHMANTIQRLVSPAAKAFPKVT